MLANLLFTSVENTRFQRLLVHFDPHFLLPECTYSSDGGLIELNYTTYSHVENLLNEEDSPISFTCDICTSDISPMSLLILTAQWIDMSFQFCKGVLQAQEFHNSHTAAALMTKYDNMFRMWQTPREIVMSDCQTSR